MLGTATIYCREGSDLLVGSSSLLSLPQNLEVMTEASESTKKWRMYAIISLVATVLLLIFVSEFFWLGLPFLLTSTVKAFGAM